MAARCQGAREDGVVELAGWRLIINHRGIVTLVPEPRARVPGLIWRLTPACNAALDRDEGVAKGVYREEELEAGGAPALMYLAMTWRTHRRSCRHCTGIRCAWSIRPSTRRTCAS